MILCSGEYVQKSRPAKKFSKLSKELKTLVLEARKKGHKVDFNWPWTKFLVIYHIAEWSICSCEKACCC